DGLFQFGHRKDHRPDLPQVKVMLSALDPLGLPLTTAVLRGERADGTTFNRRAPVQVAELTGVVAVAAADASSHTSLALRSDGTVSAWGNDTDEQLGAYSTDVALWNGSVCSCAIRPVLVRAPTGIIAIAAGGGHCLALIGDGAVWVWGNNSAGQLLEGADNPRGVPVQIHALRGVCAIATGGSHSLALLSDGTVLAWGFNNAWQLGDGTTTARAKPLPVRALDRVVALAAGQEHNLALRDDGTFWCWGQNAQSHLADDGREAHSKPVRIGALTGIRTMAAGPFHYLAVQDGGSVWAWGMNTYGQLGDGSNVLRCEPVAVAALAGVESVAAGAFHSLAAGRQAALAKGPDEPGLF
ncbi:MAG: hypothetical protein HY332_22155, partial [Chloroflexi bacterium]|nr:hypothetical protein [Chloroflexota bacterium]